MSQQRPNPQTRPPASYTGRAASMTTRFMWVWSGATLLVRQGREHGRDVDWEGLVAEQHFRGWFDPETEELFLVGPSPGPGGVPTPLRRIPRALDRALRRRFSDGLVYRVF